MAQFEHEALCRAAPPRRPRGFTSSFVARLSLRAFSERPTDRERRGSKTAQGSRMPAMASTTEEAAPYAYKRLTEAFIRTARGARERGISLGARRTSIKSF